MKTLVALALVVGLAALSSVWASEKGSVVVESHPSPLPSEYGRKFVEQIGQSLEEWFAETKGAETRGSWVIVVSQKTVLGEVLPLTAHIKKEGWTVPKVIALIPGSRQKHPEGAARATWGKALKIMKEDFKKEVKRVEKP